MLEYVTEMSVILMRRCKICSHAWSIMPAVPSWNGGYYAFEAEALLNNMIQSVPQREHHTSPLQRSTG
jgi:hypothetical protein